jgi:two-component system sensor histidine kinase GlrK
VILVAYAAAIAAATLIGWLVFRNRKLNRENLLMRSRLTEVEEMKKNFISHVSHELKAPLASMQETTHLMLERIPGSLTEKQQRLLELNLQSGKRLAQMIGNILDLSRLEAGIVEYDMQMSDVADLMHSVVIELSNQAREKSLALLTDIQRAPLIVECDPNRMVQLFTNLLENAVRFSARGGSVTVNVRQIRHLPPMPRTARIRMRSEERENGFALVTIADSGPGIDDAHKEAIFHTFHQMTHGKKSLGESLGLGLAISRAVVEAHRGTIWVEDNASGGAIFYVLFPRMPTESLAKAS